MLEADIRMLPQQRALIISAHVGPLLQGLRLNKVSYATLIEAHVRAGQLSEASQWAAAASIAGVQLDAWAYTALLKGRLQVTPNHDEIGAIACTPTCVGLV